MADFRWNKGELVKCRMLCTWLILWPIVNQVEYPRHLDDARQWNCENQYFIQRHIELSTWDWENDKGGGYTGYTQKTRWGDHLRRRLREFVSVDCLFNKWWTLIWASLLKQCNGTFFLASTWLSSTHWSGSLFWR